MLVHSSVMAVSFLQMLRNISTERALKRFKERLRSDIMMINNNSNSTDMAEKLRLKREQRKKMLEENPEYAKELAELERRKRLEREEEERKREEALIELSPKYNINLSKVVHWWNRQRLIDALLNLEEMENWEEDDETIQWREKELDFLEQFRHMAYK